MTPDAFLHAYAAALASQRWAAVDPLVHEHACVTFSDGRVHKGKAAVQRAFEANFASIEDETYGISRVHWIRRGPDTAVYTFDFRWTGRIGGREAQGAGRGTSVLVREGDAWKLLAEHLGTMPS